MRTVITVNTAEEEAEEAVNTAGEEAEEAVNTVGEEAEEWSLNLPTNEGHFG